MVIVYQGATRKSGIWATAAAVSQRRDGPGDHPHEQPGGDDEEADEEQRRSLVLTSAHESPGSRTDRRKPRRSAGVERSVLVGRRSWCDGGLREVVADAVAVLVDEPRTPAAPAAAPATATPPATAETVTDAVAVLVDERCARATAAAATSAATTPPSTSAEAVADAVAVLVDEAGARRHIVARGRGAPERGLNGLVDRLDLIVPQGIAGRQREGEAGAEHTQRFRPAPAGQRSDALQSNDGCADRAQVGPTRQPAAQNLRSGSGRVGAKGPGGATWRCSCRRSS